MQLERSTYFAAASASFFGAVILCIVGCHRDSATNRVTAKSTQNNPAEFVDEALCVSCHAIEASRWRGSHHEQAMQSATTTTVLGAFSGATFQARDSTTRFSQTQDRFVIT